MNEKDLHGLSFKIYNYYCLKEFKEEWNIMSNDDLEEKNCSILKIFYIS